MIRHTNKKTKLFGVLFGLAVLGLTIGAANVSAEGKTATEEVPVQFTFNSTLNLTVSEDNMTISQLAPGLTAESNTVTLTVDTNNASGFYLSATAGGENTDLTSSNGSKFTSMAAESDLSSAANQTWGFAYAVGSADLAASKYNGLPLDGKDQGATGKKLINANNPSADKTVKCKIGAKAGPATAAGTYTNVVNFYLVAQ